MDAYLPSSLRGRTIENYLLTLCGFSPLCHFASFNCIAKPDSGSDSAPLCCWIPLFPIIPECWGHAVPDSDILLWLDYSKSFYHFSSYQFTSTRVVYSVFLIKNKFSRPTVCFKNANKNKCMCVFSLLFTKKHVIIIRKSFYNIIT